MEHNQQISKDGMLECTINVPFALKYVHKFDSSLDPKQEATRVNQIVSKLYRQQEGFKTTVLDNLIEKYGEKSAKIRNLLELLKKHKIKQFGFNTYNQEFPRADTPRDVPEQRLAVSTIDPHGNPVVTVIYFPAPEGEMYIEASSLTIDQITEALG